MTDTDVLPPEDQVAMRNLDSQTHEPPPTRLGAAWAIRARIIKLREQDDIRAKRRAKIDRWIDGAKPYSQDALDSTQQGDRANFNPRTAQAMVEQSATPYYGITFRNSLFASLTCCYGANKTQTRQWALKEQKNYHAMLEEWRGWDYRMQLLHAEGVTHGIGLAMFPDGGENWMWESRRQGEVLVPDETPATIDSIPEGVYFQKIDAVDLYKLIEDEKAAQAMGWFPERVKNAIANVAPHAITQPGATFGRAWVEQYADMLRRGDTAWNGSKINLAGYLVKEFNGKISRVILVDSKDAPAIPNPKDPNQDKDEQFLLFKKVEEFERFDQILQPWFHTIGKGDWHSVRGLGGKIRDLTIADARIFCRLVDLGIKGTALIFQALDSTGEQISQLIEIAGATIIPASQKLEQHRIDQTIEGPRAIRGQIQESLQNSTGEYLPRVAGDTDEPTLGQAQLNYQDRARLTESAIDRYMQFLDALHHEMNRRSMIMGVRLYKERHKENSPPDPDEAPDDFKNEAERLAYWRIRRDVEDGIPLEALDPKWWTIKATRGAGSGSPAGTDIATREVVALSPTMPPNGQRAAYRARVAFLMGQSNVDQFYPPYDEAGIPDDHAALATLENNALRIENGEVLVTPDQEPVIHCQVHLSDCFQHAQTYEQGGGDPVALFIHLIQAGTHVKQHLNTFVGDKYREDVYKQLESQWLLLSKVADKLHQQITEAAKAQAQQAAQHQPGGMDPDLAMQLFKANGELQIKRMQTEAEIGLKAEKQRANQRIADVKTAHKMMLDQFTASQEAAQNQPTALPSAA